MAFKVVRDDIARMKIEAAVNLRQAQRDDQHIAYSFDDEDLIMPRSRFRAGQVIQMTLPSSGDDEKSIIRSCYEKMLQEAKIQGITNLAIPLIPTTDPDYSKEEGMRIAADAIYSFLAEDEMSVSLVIPTAGRDKQESAVSRNLDKLLKRMPKDPDEFTFLGSSPIPAASAMMGAAMNAAPMAASTIGRERTPIKSFPWEDFVPPQREISPCRWRRNLRIWMNLKRPFSYSLRRSMNLMRPTKASWRSGCGICPIPFPSISST